MKRAFPLILSAMMVLAAPAFADDLLGKGGKGGGGGGSKPPVRGGGSGGGSAPPVRGGGGGQSAPPVRGGGGQSSPPVRGGSGTSGGSNSGGLGRGGSSTSGGRTGGATNSGNQGSQPPFRGGQPGRQNNDELLGRRSGNEASRSGRVGYEGTSNANSQRGGNNAPVTRGNDYRIPNPPVVRSDTRISREGAAERGNINQRYDNRYRSGYYHYDNRWTDNYYWYPHYRFGYDYNCVPSPFYHYPHLPGYITLVRIELGGITWQISGRNHSWSYGGRSGGGWNNDWGWGRNNRQEIDYAADDIYDAFRHGSMRSMDSLIPSRGRVTVELDAFSRYTLSGDDFYDLMRDLVEGTWTTDYRITNVRLNGRQASIEAQHAYQDPWGRTQYSRHFYGLEQQGRGNYEIVYFQVRN